MELSIVLAIVMLLFGATRLPKLARSLGESAKEFKKGVGDAVDRDPGPVGENNDTKSS
jgi:sec-independent protein translocase protein TatA